MKFYEFKSVIATALGPQPVVAAPLGPQINLT